MKTSMLLLVAAYFFADIPKLSTARMENPPGIFDTNSQNPADSWESFIRSVAHGVFYNDSDPASYVTFERNAQGFVDESVASDFREPYYSHKVAEDIELHFHYFNKSTRVSDNYTEFKISDDVSDSSAVVKILESIITDRTKDRSVIVLLAKFKYNPLQATLKKKAQSHSNERWLASDILSVSLYSEGASEFEFVKESVPIVYKLATRSNNLTGPSTGNGRKIIIEKPHYSCEYFDMNQSVWSGGGCRLAQSSPGEKQCACNHTTSFALIVSLEYIVVPPALETAIQIIEGVSILALLMTILVLIVFKRLIEIDRLITQLGIASSLFFMHMSFLVGFLALEVEEENLCIFATIACHLFTLSSAMWMLNEGIMLFLKIRNSSLKLIGKTHKAQLLLSGCLFPALYVAICASVGLATNSYIEVIYPYRNAPIKYAQCWLSGSKGMTLSAIVPLGAIFIVNLVILVVAVRVVQKMDKFVDTLKPKAADKEKQWVDRHSQLLSTLRATIMLFPVLGIPWLLGFLVNVPGAQIIFVAIHGVVNGFQGVFVFLIFFFKNKTLREAAKRKLIDFTQAISASHLQDSIKQ